MYETRGFIISVYSQLSVLLIWNEFATSYTNSFISILILSPNLRLDPPSIRSISTNIFWMFRAHGSVHHNSILIKIQLDATVGSLIYFTAKSLYMFRVSIAPIIRILKTVSAASGTGHNIGTATSIQRGPMEVTVPKLWPVPEAADTVFSTPDDGCCGHPKHVQWLCSKINQTAYCCI